MVEYVCHRFSEGWSSALYACASADHAIQLSTAAGAKLRPRILNQVVCGAQLHSCPVKVLSSFVVGHRSVELKRVVALENHSIPIDNIVSEIFHLFLQILVMSSQTI